jgi:hypothetical protein
MDAGSGYLRGKVDAANARSAITGHICAQNTGCVEYTGQLAASYSTQDVSVPVPGGAAITYVFSEALSDANGVERVRLYTATNAAFLSNKLFCAVSGGVKTPMIGGGGATVGGGGAPSGGGAPFEPGSGPGTGKGIGG